MTATSLTLPTVAPYDAELSAEQLTETLEFDFSNAVEALDHHVRTTPERPAVFYGETGQRLDYGAFGEQTDRLAGNLARHGVHLGDRVGVFSTNPLIATLLMYGSWKCGGVYAPVNFQYQDELFAYVLRDSAPKVLVLDRALLPVYESIAPDLLNPPTVFVIDGDGLRHEIPVHDFAGELLAPAARPEHTPHYADAANVIYTSGTTGPSKGVVQSHRWITAYTWLGRRFLAPDDVVYNDLPMYHIGGAHFGAVRSLWAGASVALWNRFSPQAFWDRIRESGATSAVLLDVMMPWLLNVPESDQDRNNTLNKVHLQPLPVNHNAFARRFGIDFVTCAFAQSESGNTLAALIEEVPEGEGTPADHYHGLGHAELREVFDSLGLPIMSGEEETPKGFMGRPGLFTEVAVVDEHDRPCPAGVVGQLALRPRLPYVLFDGYLEKPAATVHSWRNLWFHTGDAAMRREDGTFSFVDRMGDRLRVRGENISGYDIEEMLTRHPSIALAAVVAIPGAEGDEDDIVAFVEIDADHEFDAEAIRAHCEKTMPKFMRPRDVVPIDALPRTPTNKVEKYKLRQRYLADRDGA